MPAPRTTESTIRFTATLRPPPTAEKTASSALILPTSASAKLPSRDATIVEATINGFPFRATLEPNGSGSHLLKLDQALRDAAAAQVGDTVTVEITRVAHEPELRLPLDLHFALADAPIAQLFWSKITPMARRDWILWISSAKQPDTRKTRIAKACDMLSSGKKRVCCFGGLNWLRQDHPTAGDTWLPLSTSKPLRKTN